MSGYNGCVSFQLLAEYVPVSGLVLNLKGIAKNLVSAWFVYCSGESLCFSLV